MKGIILALIPFMIAATTAQQSPKELRKHNPFTNFYLWRGRREIVDLHNDEFCVDVSTFGEVKFEPTPREKCDSTFAKECELKEEQVCNEVTEIQCEVVPYTECSMTMDIVSYKSYEMTQKIFKRKTCTEGMDTVQHTKMMPECKNVTKQNCITKWETDENGNQVWAGNEDCEPVTWRECQLVPRQVDFKVPKITCEEGEEIPYTDCEDSEKERMISNMVCEVKSSTNCKPIVSTKCATVSYQECTEVPEEKCETQEMMVPMQVKEHKKKCLLPDDGSFGAPRSAKSLNDDSFGDDDQAKAAKASVLGQAQLAAALAETTIEGRGEKRQLAAEETRPVRQIHFQKQQQHLKHQRPGRTFEGHVSSPRVAKAHGQKAHPRFVQHVNPPNQGQRRQ